MPERPKFDSQTLKRLLSYMRAYKGTLVNGHRHGVGDVQRGNKQADGRQTRQAQLALCGLLLHLLAVIHHGADLVAFLF